MNLSENIKNFLEVVKKHDIKRRHFDDISDDYYEPGNMEYLDKYLGEYNEITRKVILQTEIKGLRYENRSQLLNELSIGDKLCIVRDNTNEYNINNFMVVNANGKSLGTLSAELCNVIAPLYDNGYVTIEDVSISYIEKLIDRSRYAKQGILFIKMQIHTLFDAD